MDELTEISARQKIIGATYCPAKGKLNDVYGCAFCKYYHGKIKEPQGWCIVCSFASDYTKELKENNNESKK